MSISDTKGFFEASREAVNRELDTIAAEVRAEVGGDVGEAMAYSLTAPGKRFRPALLLATFGVLNGRGDPVSLAAAVEVVHTYSLVHDDLPCMDNDDLRRGRPTTHVKYGVAAATEAAFKMVPLAARVLSRAAAQLGLTSSELGGIGMELFRGAGAAGMVGGQVLDLEAEGRAIAVEELVRIHRMKTGALITASAVVGALAARAPAGKVSAIRSFGAELGLAFQIVDDILDATSTSQELGKTAGKDAQQQKATFTTILRHDEARAEAEACISRAVDHVDSAGLGSGLLHDIAAFIINRRS